MQGPLPHSVPLRSVKSGLSRHSKRTWTWELRRKLREPTGWGEFSSSFSTGLPPGRCLLALAGVGGLVSAGPASGVARAGPLGRECQEEGLSSPNPTPASRRGSPPPRFTNRRQAGVGVAGGQRFPFPPWSGPATAPHRPGSREGGGGAGLTSHRPQHRPWGCILQAQGSRPGLAARVRGAGAGGQVLGLPVGPARGHRGPGPVRVSMAWGVAIWQSPRPSARLWVHPIPLHRGLPI